MTSDMYEGLRRIAQIARADGRYRFEAYLFVFESLRYAQEVLNMGDEQPSEPAPAGRREAARPDRPERHLTGQQLCEAARRWAQEQFGLMAECVMRNWGLRKTGDIGEIVYTLIAAGEMKKTARDRREDFDDVFDFSTGFRDGFQISILARENEEGGEEEE